VMGSIGRTDVMLVWKMMSEENGFFYHFPCPTIQKPWLLLVAIIASYRYCWCANNPLYSYFFFFLGSLIDLCI
jgi:hypothetical protein